MNIKSFFSFIKSPSKYITQLGEQISENKMEKLGYIPINEFEQSDVFIVEFPKSGITWLQSLIAGIQYGIDTQYLPDKLVQEIVPDIYIKPYYKRFGDIKIFKSHELPQKRYKRVIYLVRDGRDAIISYYHFNKKLNNNASLEEMLKLNKHIYPVPWWEHVDAWIKNPFDAKIIFIRYEDLLLNTENELRKICNFLQIKRDPDLLEKIIKGSTIEKMREKAQKYGGLAHPNWQGDKSTSFFRKGKIGDYKDEMPEDLIKFFEQKAKKQLSYFNYNLNYETAT